MPGIKGLNCSAAAAPENVSSSSTVEAPPAEEENWKFYDNPFFAAAVASAVVEATLNQQRNTTKQEAEKKLKQQLAPSSSRAPAAPRVTPGNSSKRSPETKQRAADETNQKLRLELLKAWTSIERLEKAHAASKQKAERLSSRLEDGKSLWESQVQDKITSSLQAIKHKLKEERAANKSLEQTNQKLESELLEIRRAVSEARKEITSEKNSKKMIENVCDELAKEVGEDRAMVIELRKQSSSARREAEDTRRALQMGEVWKEEKVQGRLTEARLKTEQKFMDMEKMVLQVEGFLEEKKMKMELQGGYDSASSSSCNIGAGDVMNPVERKAYREQTRLLLNGSGFHMRMNKAYGRSPSHSLGTAGMPKIWPRMSDKSKE